MKPQVFQNLQGLSVTLKPKSSHQQLVFSLWRVEKQGSEFFLPEQSFSAGQAGWAGSESSLGVHLGPEEV